MMGVADTIEALLQLGVSAKDAFTKAQSNKTATDWVTFLGSPEFAGIEDDVTGLVGKLTQADLDAALAAVRQKETALLATGAQRRAASERQAPSVLGLATHRVAPREPQGGERYDNRGGAAWVVNEALPDAVTAAKMILPLLL